MSLKALVNQYPVTARDAKRIAAIAMAMAAFDVAQSYWMQRVVVNPWSEANLLPLNFFRYGALGYIAYWPIETVAIFATLLLLWSLVSWLIPKMEEKNVL